MEEDFDAYDPDENWLGSGVWIVENPAQTSLGEAFAYLDSVNGISISGGDEAGVASVYRRGFDLEGPKVDVSWHVNMRDTTARYDIYTRGQSEGYDSEHTVCGVTFENGTISYIVSATGEGLAVGSYEPDTWHEITARIDLESQSFSLWIDEEPVGEGIPFPDTSGGKIASVDMVVMAKTTPGAGEVWFDDVSIATSRGDTPNSPGIAAPTTWAIPLEANLWKLSRQAAQAQEGQSDLMGGIAGAASVRTLEEASAEATDREHGILFDVTGRASVRSVGKWRWTSDQRMEDEGFYEYFLVRYRTRGIQRSLTPQPLLSAVGRTGAGKLETLALLDSAEGWNDDQWQLVTGRLERSLTPESLEVEIQSMDTEASLEISALAFCKTADEVAQLIRQASPPVRGADALPPLESIDLKADVNKTAEEIFADSMSKHRAATDAMLAFRERSVVEDGIPFEVQPTGDNVIWPQNTAGVNDQLVPFLGAPGTRVKRIDFGPISRDDTISVEINRKASEVFLLLVSEMPTRWQAGATFHIPYQAEDVESDFVIELVYSDGESDWAFPYSLADGGFLIRRMAGAYVVPADESRELSRVVLHNRRYEINVGVAAVSVNSSAQRAVPEIAEEPELVRAPVVAAPGERAPSLERQGNRVVGGNTFYGFLIDCETGFTFKQWENRSIKQSFTLDDASGLEIELGDQVFDGRNFEVTEVTMEGTTARFHLRSRESELPVEATVELTVDETPELKWNAKLVNTGQKALDATIQFPSLRGLVLGELADTWLFFPKLRDVLTNREGYHRAPNDWTYPMQFFDVFNPRTGGGLAMMTRNKKNAPLDYLLSKDETGVTAGIIYPPAYYALQPGEPVELTETSLLVHSGDWHDAMDSYRTWVDTWYQPVESQDKAWFLDAFWVRNLNLNETISKLVEHTPSVYDPQTGEYRIDEYFEADREVFGIVPDFVHFFAWYSAFDEWEVAWPGVPRKAYDNAGGLTLLKSAVETIQEQVPVSLYFLPDRIVDTSDSGTAMEETMLRRLADGQPAPSVPGTFGPCPNTQAYYDWVIDMVQPPQVDTGADIVYLDVFPFSRAATCYAPDHGHPVPSWNNVSSVETIRSLRESLDPKVAIWTEYPMTDVGSQYVDGNIAYYFLRLPDFLVQSFNDVPSPPTSAAPMQSVYRYVFPKVKQFSLPHALEGDTWGRLKFPFFNGEALFIVTWRLYPTRAVELLQKCVGIQRAYKDCFTSDRPRPMVPTERADVFANEFPVKDRTVWTLYNARNTTVRGDVLEVAHKEGATYRDLWNDEPLTPTIRDGKALLSLKLDPQGLGCVVQEISAQ